MRTTLSSFASVSSAWHTAETNGSSAHSINEQRTDVIKKQVYYRSTQGDPGLTRERIKDCVFKYVRVCAYQRSKALNSQRASDYGDPGDPKIT